MAKDSFAPTCDYVKSALDYDPETGHFTWKERKFKSPYSQNTWNTRYAGTRAGKVSKDGYVQIHIYYRLFYAHRLAWFITSGKWPLAEIDHKNGDRSDNRIENLREADSAGNKRNRGASKNNRSGYKGVSKLGNKWRAQIRASGKTRHLGLFDTPETAHAAYQRAARELHGDFARFK